MAKLTAKFDLSQVFKGLDKLSAKGYSLGRRMGVSGIKVMKEEARANAPISSPPYNPISRGSQAPETLKNAIYGAFSDARSTPTLITYSVSWNRHQAWWGHLAEYGWLQTHKIEWVPGGDYFITTKIPLPEPIFHPGTKFLSRSYEASIDRAREAMLQRGREELAILLAEP
jgi:hypothetical protein